MCLPARVCVCVCEFLLESHSNNLENSRKTLLIGTALMLGATRTYNEYDYIKHAARHKCVCIKYGTSFIISGAAYIIQLMCVSRVLTSVCNFLRL